ncbi:BAG family molecular chaperone regulator 4 [Prunus yedoensis var. nudiflora]|uniref:BAG family molecular chaperone regulator 4 n=1 Tax=Prunus yedoensis var. nudiflora TaxID=2094558 RepID=A0A314Z1Q3_PRUYE|nr:BAG family molecular chaperone regulator 4 [Prunus yedoensis var. nudiflora]
MVKKNPNLNPKVPVPVQNEEIDWEMRPGGMLVQRREDGDDPSAAAASASASSRGPMIKIDVVHGPAHQAQYELFVPAHSTFGDVKIHLAQKTGLEPSAQKLFFRGKEKEDEEQLHIAGVKDNSKVLLMEDRKSEEKKVEELKESKAGEIGDNSNADEIGVKSSDMSKAFQAIAEVRAEVDKLSDRVAALEVAVGGGPSYPSSKFQYLLSLLFSQTSSSLKSLTTIGDSAMNSIALNSLLSMGRGTTCPALCGCTGHSEARNSNPFNNSSNAASVTTKWETFDSGVGCLSAPTPKPSSTEVNQDWEHFD